VLTVPAGLQGETLRQRVEPLAAEGVDGGQDGPKARTVPDAPDPRKRAAIARRGSGRPDVVPTLPAINASALTRGGTNAYLHCSRGSGMLPPT
jgi:hypothetical protein